MTSTTKLSLLLALWMPVGCVDPDLDSLKCGLAPSSPGCPTTPFVPKTCSELRASQFHWSLSGFSAKDILNPDTRDQRELTAIMHVGEAKILKVSAASGDTSEDCSTKATTVEWSLSNRAVARLDFQGTSRAASLVALQPGDANVAAILQFDDGTPSMRILPWSFTGRGQRRHHRDSSSPLKMPPNKGMKLTKLRAAPVLQAEVPPCAPAGQTDGGTASQLIRSVLRTRGGATGHGRILA
jgi:hypothetical protein